MPQHDYSPAEALRILISEIGRRHVGLANYIKGILEAGKEVDNHAERVHMKVEPYSVSESIDVVVEILKSYFVEYCLFIKSANENIVQEYTDEYRYINIDGLSIEAQQIDALAGLLPGEDGDAVGFIANMPAATTQDDDIALLVADNELIVEQVNNFKTIVKHLNFK